MLLTIDVGNTQIKAAVFEKSSLLNHFIFPKTELLKEINHLLNKFPKIEDLVVVSVGNVDEDFFLPLEKKVIIHFITHNSKFPFTNLYSTPNTLGMDRMILASGAVMQFPNLNRLVIDAGTCITYDFIDENNNYLGGAISPGVRLRYESLNQQTANLPLLTKSHPQNFIGNSTTESIHSGVINGIALEIDGFIELYKTQYTNIITILTGGDSDFLAKQLKNTIFANSNFLLESLNQLFQFNQK